MVLSQQQTYFIWIGISFFLSHIHLNFFVFET